MKRPTKPEDAAQAEAAPRREEVMMLASELVPNPRNERLHDDDQIRGLAAALRRDGQTKPLLARRENKMLIAGHGVQQAALSIGLERLAVVLLDVDQDSADRIMLSDNRHGDRSTTDAARAAELLRNIDASDWLATGYTDKQAESLLAKVDAAELVVHEIETSDRKDTFWISVYGPLADQAAALQRLKALYAEMPTITVMLGTTLDLS